MAENYIAWDGKEYPLPAPDGWELKTDGRYWPAEHTPPADSPAADSLSEEPASEPMAATPAPTINPPAATPPPSFDPPSFDPPSFDPPPAAAAPPPGPISAAPPPGPTHTPAPTPAPGGFSQTPPPATGPPSGMGQPMPAPGSAPMPAPGSAPMPAPGSAPVAAPATPKKGLSKGLIVLLAVLGVIVLGIGSCTFLVGRAVDEGVNQIEGAVEEFEGNQEDARQEIKLETCEVVDGTPTATGVVANRSGDRSDYTIEIIFTGSDQRRLAPGRASVNSVEDGDDIVFDAIGSDFDVTTAVTCGLGDVTRFAS